MKYPAILVSRLALVVSTVIITLGCNEAETTKSSTDSEKSQAVVSNAVVQEIADGDLDIVINDNVIAVITNKKPSPATVKENDVNLVIHEPLIDTAIVPITDSSTALIKKSSEDFSKLPNNAAKYLPMLRDVATLKWSEFPAPSIFAAQTEKESCTSLKHKNCWSPYAEFKTKLEYGFGFGQITIAYDKAGKVRFNKFEELKRMDADLKNWQYIDRHNAYMQFIALVVLNKINYKALAGIKTKTETDKVAMMLAAYNGGLGGVTGEIRLCKETPGCDPERWFGHVEKTTRKSKAKPNGYGNSFADINRLYPFDILYTRREKYLPFFNDRISHPKLASAPHKF